MGGVWKIYTQPVVHPKKRFFVAADVDGNASGGEEYNIVKFYNACVKSIADSPYWRRMTLCWYSKILEFLFFWKEDFL